jgi:hypothetical protein
MLNLFAAAIIADASPQQPKWCELPKPGQAIVLVHDSRLWNDIQEFIPPGAKAVRCKWWVNKPADVPTPLSIQIGFFSNPRNASANASEIWRSLFADSDTRRSSRIVEVYRNERVQKQSW